MQYVHLQFAEPYVCKETAATAVRTLQPVHYSQYITASTLQPVHYSQYITASTHPAALMKSRAVAGLKWLRPITT